MITKGFRKFILPPKATEDVPYRKFLSGEFTLSDLFSSSPGPYKLNFTHSDFDRIAYNTYNRSSDFREAVDTIVSILGDLPLCLMDAKKERGDLTDKLNLFISRPMNNTSWSEFLAKCFVQYFISGEIVLYDHIKGLRDDMVLKDLPNLFLVYPSELRKIRYVDGLAYSYILNNQFFTRNKIMNQGSMLEYKGKYQRGKWVNQVSFYCKGNPIGKEGRGLSPAAPLFNDIQIIIDGKVWNMNLLRNNGLPSGALFYPPTSANAMNTGMSSTLVGENKTEEDIITKVSGPENARKIIFLKGGLQFKELTMKPVDLDYLAGLKHSRKNIFSLLGFPVQMITDDKSTYNNVKEARQSFVVDTCIPLLNSFLSHLSKNILIPNGVIEDERMELAVDLEATEVANMLRLEKMKSLETNNFLTTNEKREACNYEKSTDDNADSILVDSGKTLLEEVGFEKEFGGEGGFGNEGDNNKPAKKPTGDKNGDKNKE